MEKIATTSEVKEKQAFERRFRNLKDEYQKYLSSHQDLSDYINPVRGIFDNNRDKIGQMIDHKKLIRSYSTHALRIFAAGLNSGMTNKSTRWFEPTFENDGYLEIPGAREALDTLERRMYAILNRSNVYDVLYSSYEELGQFGPACFIVLDDYEDVVRFRSFTAGEYYLGINNKGRVNAFAREFEMTVEQMVHEFGLESVSSQVAAFWENNDLDKKIKVNHIIEENKQRNEISYDYEDMPYRSVYWEYGNTEGFLAKRGYKRFPVIAPRWNTITTDDVYGYSPGWHALGSIKELQVTIKDKLLAQEKYHNPPVLEDSSVDGYTNVLPGGKTKLSSAIPNSGVRAAYQIDMAMESYLQAIEEIREEIDRFFYVNLFLMLINVNTGTMTATEVAERQQEKLMMLGPALHRMDEEMLTPMLTLVYGIMEDNGLLPEFPPELQGQEIKINYTSILAQTQKAIGVTKIERVLGIVTASAPLDPDVVDVVDFDEVVRQTSFLEGAPAKIIRDKRDIEAIREQKAQQQNAMMAMQAVESGSKSVKNLASAPTDTENALTGIQESVRQ